jgi:hypothetical protein
MNAKERQPLLPFALAKRAMNPRLTVYGDHQLHPTPSGQIEIRCEGKVIRRVKTLRGARRVIDSIWPAQKMGEGSLSPSRRSET